MISSYIATAARNIVKSKVSSIIAALGFALGLGCATLIFLYASYELSYDRFFEGHDRIRRVLLRTVTLKGVESLTADVPHDVKDALASRDAGIEAMTQLSGASSQIGFRDRFFFEEDLLVVDPMFLEVFSYRVAEGDRRTALSAPFSAVLTRSAARKYFGDGYPLGKVLSFKNAALGDKEYLLTVTAVLEDPPENSSLDFSMAIHFPVEGIEAAAFAHYREAYGVDVDPRYATAQVQTYVRLAGGSSEPRFRAALAEVAGSLGSAVEARYAFKSVSLASERLDRIYLFSKASGPSSKRGDFSLIAAMSGLGIVVLAIACMNVINLLTARGMTRAKEIGVRKAVGASRAQLVAQFLIESLVLCLASLLVALAFVELFLPRFNDMVKRGLSMADLADPGTILLLLALAVASGLLSGYYPALRLSSLEAAGVSGRVRSPEAKRLKEAMVVAQFVFSIGLFAASATILGDFRFARGGRLGFDPGGVAMLRIGAADVERRVAGLKSAISEIPGVAAVASTSFAAWEKGMIARQYPILHIVKGGYADVMVVDSDYPRVRGLRVLEGRGFSRAEAGTDLGQLLVNEAAASALGIGVGSWLDDKEVRGQVVGVVEDFYYLYPSRKVGPLILSTKSPFLVNTSSTPVPVHLSYILVKLSSPDRAAAAARIEEVWKRMMGGYSFELAFEDEEMARQLDERDRSFEAALGVATVLAFLLSGLGLFGLASFEMERRTREVGIRRALGAGRPRLVLHYLGGFLKLVLAANLIALPLVALGLGPLLSALGYPRALSFEPGAFLAAALASVAVTVLSVGYQVLKAARAEPSESLRYE